MLFQKLVTLLLFALAAGDEEEYRRRARALYPARTPRQGQRIQLAARTEGPFAMYMRLYWPAEAALDGSWTQPPLETVK